VPGAALPSLPVVPDWKEQRRLWGHAFHPMCSYLGAFPAPLAHAFVSRLSRPGDLVLDPYCGRGTVPLEAAVGNRVGVGIDANPLAHVLTAAKLDSPSKLEAETRLAHLRVDWVDQRADWLAIARAGSSALFEGSNRLETLPAPVAAAFETDALAQVLYLQRRLAPADRIDRFLIAALMGILHGRSSGYISDLMPNGFSLSPAYATRAMTQTATGAHARRRPRRPSNDPMTLLERKLRRLYRDGLPRTRGMAYLGDAVASVPEARRQLRARGLGDRFRLVMSSPPYLRTLRYGSANWLRLWFLGADPLAVDEATAGPGTPECFGASIEQLLGDLRPGLTDDAVVVLVVGDVSTERGKRRDMQIELAQAAWELGAEGLGYRLAGVIADPVPSNRKLTRLWGDEAGQSTEVDQILVIAPTELGRRRALASLDAPVDWAWPRRSEWSAGGASRHDAAARSIGAGQSRFPAPTPSTIPASHEPAESVALAGRPVTG
jgi:site-specific DNA-methyltransferase (adenine-specific)